MYNLTLFPTYSWLTIQADKTKRKVAPNNPVLQILYLQKDALETTCAAILKKLLYSPPKQNEAVQSETWNSLQVGALISSAS